MLAGCLVAAAMSGAIPPQCVKLLCYSHGRLICSALEPHGYACTIAILIAQHDVARACCQAAPGAALPPNLRDQLSGPIVLPSSYLRHAVAAFQVRDRVRLDGCRGPAARVLFHLWICGRVGRWVECCRLLTSGGSCCTSTTTPQPGLLLLGCACGAACLSALQIAPRVSRLQCAQG